MLCLSCGSDSMASVSGKCSDMCSFSVGDDECHGYVPYDVGIGGGDYLELDYCLNCGKIRGDFPIAEEAVVEIFGGK